MRRVTLDAPYDRLAPIDRDLIAPAHGLATAVRDILEEAILDGRLGAGTRLNADALAARFGLSHIPVREALRALAADGWIDVRHRASASVCQRSERELIDIFEARLLLEAESARLAALRRTPEQVDALDAVLEQQRSTTVPVEVARLNAAFHVLVAESSQNQMHARFVQVLAKRARFYFSDVVTLRRDTSIEDHAALVHALRRRDPDAAAEIARQHVSDTCDSVLESLRHDHRA